MKKYFFVILLLSAYLAVYYGCSDSATSTGDLKQVDPTILRTDQFGNELGGDTSDWCSGSPFAFNPAYPNPTNDTFNIRLSIPVTDTISLYFLNSITDTLFIMRDQMFVTGVYTASFSGHSLNFRYLIKRLYIRTKTNFINGISCRNYGDIQFF